MKTPFLDKIALSIEWVRRWFQDNGWAYVVLLCCGVFILCFAPFIGVGGVLIGLFLSFLLLLAVAGVRRIMEWSENRAWYIRSERDRHAREERIRRGTH